VPALVTNNFRIHNSKQFREMLSEASLIGGTGISSAEETALSTHVYLFIGKSDSWSGSFSDQVQLRVHHLIQHRTPIILIGRI